MWNQFTFRTLSEFSHWVQKPEVDLGFFLVGEEQKPVCLPDNTNHNQLPLNKAAFVRHQELLANGEMCDNGLSAQETVVEHENIGGKKSICSFMKEQYLPGRNVSSSVTV